VFFNNKPYCKSTLGRYLILGIQDSCNFYRSYIKDLKYIKLTLLVVLYVCETWSLTLREEHGLSMFENSVLRGIFGCERNGVTEGWRKLHNELHNLHSSQNITIFIQMP
jgi:hypothetical protein